MQTSPHCMELMGVPGMPAMMQVGETPLLANKQPSIGLGLYLWSGFRHSECKGLYLARWP